MPRKDYPTDPSILQRMADHTQLAREVFDSGLGPSVQGALTVLTERQLEVLEMKIAGYTNPAIGEELGVTASTVASTWLEGKRKLRIELLKDSLIREVLRDA